ncbi:MAG: hypothetical protein GEV13_21295 [Rhodospirillales bacterium]|nr:hypothetical protein [Rhodospirillales bacterium]
MKALVGVGHPAPGSFCRALADKVRKRWSAAGCEARFHDLAEEGVRSPADRRLHHALPDRAHPARS